MKTFCIQNDWEGKYYLTNDRKVAVAAAKKMIEDWKQEQRENGGADEFEEEGDFRGTGYACKMVGCCDWKWMITITIYVDPDLSNQDEKNIINL